MGSSGGTWGRQYRFASPARIFFSLTIFSSVFFFFQAEDGIRDDLVTGVQTCALPILTIETDAKRAAEIADDLAALGEDLLMSGAYDDAKSVVMALVARATTPAAIGRDRKSVV